MFKKFKSDYLSLFNDETPLPNGYPCTFNTDCKFPSVCQYNVCTTNIGGNDISYLSDICKGMSITECSKQMQKERESTEIPIYIPEQPITYINSNCTGGTGCNIQLKPVKLGPQCNLDNECKNNEICISGVCVDKSKFPLIARQKRLKKYNSSHYQNDKLQKNVLTDYEYNYLLEEELKKENNKKYDDYEYITQL